MDNRKIKIAFFLPNLEAGGAERNVVNIINNINREKYKIILVLGKKEGDFINEIKKDILIVDLDTSNSFGLFLRLIKYFKKERFGIFVSAFSRINIICLAAKIFSRANIKIVATEHAVFSFLPIIAKTAGRRFFARFFLPYISKIIYPKADAIICVSRGIAEDLLKIVCCREKIKVIYNPIINDKIYELAEEPVDDLPFLNSEIPIILAVGRLVKCKDYSILFKAFSLVLEKQAVRLVVLGKGPEGDKLRQFVDDLSLSKDVIFMGFKKNPYKYMKRASVFILSSLQEGFGNVLVEAMACGTPVISTNCAFGPGEIIENGKSGILVPVADPRALAEAIIRVLNDRVLARKLSEQGKKRAAHFSIEESVKKYEEIFDEL